VIRVLLMPYNTAASGTNLIEASHVFLMDPSTLEHEKQAIGRAQRQGQRKNVHVVRFLLEGYDQHLYHRTHFPDTPHHYDLLAKVFPKIPRTSSLFKLLQNCPAVQVANVINSIFEDE
jgi:hypothetical protein